MNAEQLANEAMERAADEVSGSLTVVTDVERHTSALRRMVAQCDKRATEASEALRESKALAKTNRTALREAFKQTMADVQATEDAERLSWSQQIEDAERLRDAWAAALKVLEP